MTKIQVIRPYVEKTLKELLGTEQIEVTDDGTIPIRRGSTAVYVRLMDEEPPTLQVFSPLLQGVQKSPELLERLNEINGSVRFARLFWAADKVVVAAELDAETLDKEEIRTAVDVVSGVADDLDDQLRTDFGGTVLFPEPTGEPAEGELPPPPPPEEKTTERPSTPEGGYL